MINFGNIQLGNLSKKIDPTDIFMGLERDDEFQYLRDVQSEVLKKWMEKRACKNCIIKMNTGSGKTIVSLLILQSLMNENNGHTVYVVPDNLLKDQVVSSAQKIGIKVTDDKNSRDFLSNNAILIININELVNGMSAFGMRFGRKNIPIDNLVLDDVHSCISTIRDQFSIKINTDHVLYSKIYNLFKDELVSYLHVTPKNLEFMLTQHSGENILLPFWIWNNKLEKVKEIISEHVREADDGLKFNYPLLEDNLETCRCFFNENNIEITPYCIPIDKIQSLNDAKHRVFLSATLPDLTNFNTIFNISEEEIINNTISPDKVYDIGERMIIFPQYLDTSISDDDVVEKIKKYRKGQNVLVIVPSYSRAEYWCRMLEDQPCQKLSAQNIKDGIEKIRNNQFCGYTIIINKYDGIDLPSDMCRLIVIDKMPNVSKCMDLYEQNVIPNSQRINTELIQKIEQGMGRGVRSTTDYCGIVLMNNSLIETMYLGNAIQYFSEATRIQVKVSEQLWNQTNNTIDESFCLFDYLYSRDEQWKHVSKQSLINASYESQIILNRLELSIREAYNEYRKGNFHNSINILQSYMDTIIGDSLLLGYVKMLKAEYQFFINPAQAQETLKSAYANNIKVLKPAAGVNYKKLERQRGQQVVSIMNEIKELSNNDIMIKVNSCLGDLEFSENSHVAFEKAIDKLGKLLGFTTQMPEKDYNDGGPDNLWLGDSCFYVIECKNETTTDRISKSDIEQLLSSSQWFKNKYPLNINEFVPVIIHNSIEADEHANVSPEMKCMDKAQLDQLKTNVRSFFEAISNSNASTNANEIVKLLNYYHLNFSELRTYFKEIK